MRFRNAPAIVPDPDPRERALARTIGQSDLVARVLLAREIDDPERARQYLRPALDTLHDPFSFTQMERAVSRVRAAIAAGEPILIHGDYDVDGVSSTVLLLKFFALMQADVKPFIPDRSDGYSFGPGSLQAIADTGTKLCISVDNGTNAAEYVDRIQAAGCDVIVTDHHGTSNNVARAYAVLNPRLPDAGYPDRDLAGCGVAFRLATAIAQSFSPSKTLGDEFREFLIDAMAYVALGTIADVAPLCGENRTLVFHGLRALAVSANPGIRALLDSARMSNRSPDAEDVAFRIAPLINAAGRMGNASQALDLLMAPGYQEAQEAAKILEQHNLRRREVERELLEAVLAAARGRDDKILVLGGEGWHPGVLGIVAARVAETMRRPTILVAFEGDGGRGSGRSPGGIHLRKAMDECAGTLIAYGGHAAAAGLEIRRDRLDEFRRRINEVAEDMLEPAPPVMLDGRVDLAELDPREVRRLDQLGPFGPGNQRPTFLTDRLRVVGHPQVDSRGNDLRFRVASNGTVVPARIRGAAERFEAMRGLRDPVSLVHSPRLTARGEEGPVELHVVRLETEGLVLP